jgi:hypothetical protein
MFIKNQLSKTKTAPAMASERVLSQNYFFEALKLHKKLKCSNFLFKMLPATLLGPFGKKKIWKKIIYIFVEKVHFYVIFPDFRHK